MVNVDAIEVMTVLKETAFQKEKLDEQLKLHGVSRDQLLRDTLGKNPKDFANWKVKWSRLINKGIDDPKHFGLLELSKLFAKYFNEKAFGSAKIIPSTYFITPDVTIKGIGEFLPNGQIRPYNKDEKWMLSVQQIWGDFVFLTNKQGYLKGAVRFCKPLKQINFSANYAPAVIRQKKTKKLYWGFLIPQADGTYNLEDRSLIGDTKIKDIITNIHIEASSKLEGVIFPKDNAWVKK